MLLLLHQLFESGLGNVRLEDPHGIVIGSVQAILFGLLLSPRGGLIVVGLEPPVELAGQSADDFLAAAVGPAEAAGGETAEVLVRAR